MVRRIEGAYTLRTTSSQHDVRNGKDMLVVQSPREKTGCRTRRGAEVFIAHNKDNWVPRTAIDAPGQGKRSAGRWLKGGRLGNMARQCQPSLAYPHLLKQCVKLRGAAVPREVVGKILGDV